MKENNFKSLSQMELEKYHRQMTHPGFGKNEQERLKNSAILVAGIGGLGGSAVWQLAGAGIGKMVLVHAGNLEQPDLNRQTLMTQDWIGKPRIDRARETIHNFNPEIEVETHDLWINENNFVPLLEGIDMVLDARHNFKERRIINQVCVQKGIPYVEAAMNGLEGYVFSVNPGKSACLECVYKEDPPWDPFGFSVFGAVSGIIGSMAALEAVKYLSGYITGIFGVMTYIDFTNMESRQYPLRKVDDCPVCGGSHGIS